VFESVLIANRGEIARRVIRTARNLGVRTIAVHSEADADLPYVAEADDSVLIGPPAPTDSYLNIDALLGAASQAGAQAVHPGYGFLAENAHFARKIIDAGLTWIGPAPEVIEAMGDKIRARNLMEDAGVPVSAGTRDSIDDAEEAVVEAGRIGYPVMVKAAAGGGGIGMSVVWHEAEMRTAFETARSRSERFFGSAAILLERYIEGARHVEVQILGFPDGRVVALGERDCSVQRRHQKIVEETPSPGVSARLRARMLEGAIRAGQAVDYRGAGTVECLVDPKAGEFVFCEMNTRLQVEHPVTEMVTGIDLVEQQLRIASGELPDIAVAPTGHAVELRVYAEDPKRFLPSPGQISEWREPTGEGVRVDSGYRAGNTVTPYYDPLLAKLCVHGPDRATALDRAGAAVSEFHVAGPKTNVPFFAELLSNEEFISGEYDTGLVQRMREPAGKSASS
jgi:acetyl-CoA carboxylase, biotin carboxylase subunit